MNSNEEKIRTVIAEQAGEWFVANNEGPLSATDAAALAAWLKTSPVHVEEFLGIAAIARDLKEAHADPEYSVAAILARARAAEQTSVQPLWPRMIDTALGTGSGRWFAAAATMAACVLVSIGLFTTWNPLRSPGLPSAPEGITALHFETRHGEVLSHRLADNSVLHLNTDSAVTIRYGKNDRLVILTAGQANFEVAHERDRAFRVIAGPAEIVDIGTKFDVRLEGASALVTVVQGLVTVGASVNTEKPGADAGPGRVPPITRLSANQQMRVAEGEVPAAPVAVDAQRATAWMQRQIAFDHEPLERVATEFNRYSAKPIEIATPSLRKLQISGVFATDDPEAFIAFLRSLKGVHVDVTDQLIRVW
jgi:transmembrane sensor